MSARVMPAVWRARRVSSLGAGAEVPLGRPRRRGWRFTGFSRAGMAQLSRERWPTTRGFSYLSTRAAWTAWRRPVEAKEANARETTDSLGRCAGFSHPQIRRREGDEESRSSRARVV